MFTVRTWLLGNRLVSVPFGSRIDPLVSRGAELDALIRGCVEEEMPILMTGAQAGSVARRADVGVTRRAAQRIIVSSPRPVYLGFSELCCRHLG